MTTLWRQAEEILDTALRGTESGRDFAILIDRQGGMRMLDAAGWSAAGLTAEFGAVTGFRIRRGPQVTSVEGWAGEERCLIEREVDGHPTRLQAAPRLGASIPPAM